MVQILRRASAGASAGLLEVYVTPEGLSSHSLLGHILGLLGGGGAHTLGAHRGANAGIQAKEAPFKFKCNNLGYTLILFEIEIEFIKEVSTKRSVQSPP